MFYIEKDKPVGEAKVFRCPICEDGEKLKELIKKVQPLVDALKSSYYICNRLHFEAYSVALHDEAEKIMSNTRQALEKWEGKVSDE